MYTGLHVKYPLFLSDFKKKFNFLNRFSKYIYVSNFMQICPVRAELFLEDRQTDITKLKVAFQIMTPNEKEGSGRSPIIIIILKYRRNTKQLQSNTKIESLSRF